VTVLLCIGAEYAKPSVHFDRKKALGGAFTASFSYQKKLLAGIVFFNPTPSPGSVLLQRRDKIAIIVVHGGSIAYNATDISPYW